MPQDLYAVTYCTMDADADSSILGHSFILISKYNAETSQFEVVDNWAFYGLPTTEEDGFFRRLKKSWKIDVDFTGNHGMFIHEELRYLDRGKGLWGATFELNEDQYIRLMEKFKKADEDQYAAIGEFVKTNGFEADKLQKYRIYPYEHLSQLIFAWEKERARIEEREPRLKMFKLTPGKSRNCKIGIVEMLEGILTEPQIERLRGYSKRVPKWSGPQERVLLRSEGPIKVWCKKSGKKVCYRDRKDAESKLVWSLPPQQMVVQTNEAQQLFRVSEEYFEKVKRTVMQLQQLEWFFLNEVVENDFKTDAGVDIDKHKQAAIAQLRKVLVEFAILNPNEIRSDDNSWHSSFLYLMSQPRDAYEHRLINNLKSADMLTLNLYSSLVDGWELDNDVLDEYPVAVAGLLTDEKRKALCDIIGRSYLEPPKPTAMIS